MSTTTDTPRTEATPHEVTSTPGVRRARLTLTIDGVDYRVRAVPRADLPSWAIEAFTLTRDDPKLGRVRHTIAQGFEGLRCTCQDRQYRPTLEGCKHLRSAQAVVLL